MPGEVVVGLQAEVVVGLPGEVVGLLDYPGWRTVASVTPERWWQISIRKGFISISW